MKSRAFFSLSRTSTLFRPVSFINNTYLSRSSSIWAQTLGVSETPSTTEIRQALHDKVEALSMSSLPESAKSMQYDALLGAYNVGKDRTEFSNYRKWVCFDKEKDFEFLFDLHAAHVAKLSDKDHKIYFYNSSYECQAQKRDLICATFEDAGIKVGHISNSKIEVSCLTYELVKTISERAHIKQCNISEAYNLTSSRSDF